MKNRVIKRIVATFLTASMILTMPGINVLADEDIIEIDDEEIEDADEAESFDEEIVLDADELVDISDDLLQMSDEEPELNVGGLMPIELTEVTRIEPDAGIIDVDEIGEAIDSLSMQGNEITVEEYMEEYLDSCVYNHEWDKYSSNYIYNRLPEGKKRVWDALEAECNKILNSNDHFAYTDYIETTEFSTINDYSDFVQMFRYSNPQYFFLRGGGSYYDYGGGRFSYAIKLYENMADGTNRSDAITEFEAGIVSMEEDIEYTDDTEQTIKNIQAALCKNVTYNQLSVDTKHVNEQIEYTQSAYSTFTLGTTVCAGYALATCLLCNEVGIDCIGVTAPGHAYNKVRVNDSWYNIDVTWADQAERGIYYDNYLKSDAFYRSQGKTSHQIDPEYNGLAPACNQNSTSSGWYYGGVIKPAIDNKVATPVITKALDRVIISCATPDSTIYYTVDEGEPSCAYTKSLLYTDDFAYEEATTIKAIAVKDGMWDSNIAVCSPCIHESFLSPVITKATPNADGKIVERCASCSYEKVTTIHKASDVSLSESSYTYDGSPKEPDIILRDSKNSIVPASNYGIAYTNNTNAGTAKLTLTFKGSKYSGSIEKNFTINKAERPSIMPGDENTAIATGKKVSDVYTSLPEGWEISAADLDRQLPTTKGAYITVTANYTASDKTNYKITTVSLKIVMTDCSNHTVVNATTTEENRVEPTCTQKGSYDLVYTCKTCHTEVKREKRDIAAIGHSMSDYSSDNNETCSSDGTKTRHCINAGCRYTETVADVGSKDPSKHVASETRIVINEASCKEAGSERVIVKCDICDETLSDEVMPIAKLSTHTYDGGTVTKEADYREAGNIKYTCLVCGHEKNEPIAKLEFTSPVEVDPARPMQMNVTVVKGGKESLSTIAKIKGEKKWSVAYSTKKIASITNKGIIKGLKAGTVVAIVRTERGEYTVNITVEDPKFVKGTLVINKGDHELPGFSGTGLETEYTSAKPAIVAIDSITGEITGLSYGKSKITVKVGGKKYSRTVQVLDPYIAGKDFVKVNKKLKLSVKKGEKKTYEWTSSDTSIAVVDMKGRVTGLAPGRVTISALNHGVLMSKEITIWGRSFCHGECPSVMRSVPLNHALHILWRNYCKRG